MKNLRLIPLFVVLTLFLAACQATATEAPAPAQPSGTEYPAFEQSSGSEYPAPAVNPGAAIAPSSGGDASSMYPGLADGSVIEYPQLETFARNGEVARVVQSEASGMTITLKDGRIFKIAVFQPGYLEAFLQACGEVCKEIEVVNE